MTPMRQTCMSGFVSHWTRAQKGNRWDFFTAMRPNFVIFMDVDRLIIRPRWPALGPYRVSIASDSRHGICYFKNMAHKSFKGFLDVRTSREVINGGRYAFCIRVIWLRLVGPFAVINARNLLCSEVSTRLLRDWALNTSNGYAMAWVGWLYLPFDRTKKTLTHKRTQNTQYSADKTHNTTSDTHRTEVKLLNLVDSIVGG